MSSNLPLVCWSRRVLLFLINVPCMAKGGVIWRQIYLCSKFLQIVRGRLIIEGGVMLSEYGI